MSDPITQLSTAITTASTLCTEIKKTRHVGHSHTQLDLLEASLACRPSALSSPITSSYSSSQTELESYVSQMGDVNARLGQIAHPKVHRHGSGHGHHGHHGHEHKEKMEDPHFGEIRVAWEKIRDGIEKFLEGKGKAGKDSVSEVTESVQVKLEIKEEEVKAKEEVKKDEAKPDVKAAEAKAEVIEVQEVKSLA